ncbi:carbohydrate kinase [Dokdonia sinensis]|uniref:Carbohydrate kinase n=1 Tax=Dokdonia sinensis TaxID=2479847 RepID=A0A3M0G333_9FLAO|nr:FGGY family carbohydrate kinase [Dokdonia sinensis]RMB56612.1 carbohydrate kinase [Dokdonia sinensis]
MKYYIGYDLGTSSLKVSLIDAGTGMNIATTQEPATEMEFQTPQPEWAEQDPELWYNNLCIATKRLFKEKTIVPKDIKGIGIAYQMHGLVTIDKSGNIVRPAIIWCDSRAVDIGDSAFAKMGSTRSLNSLLNSPANLTASKLKWIKDNEPKKFAQIHKIMLPGDYLAYRLSGETTTTKSGLSEGVFWDFKKDEVSTMLMEHFGFEENVLSSITPSLGHQCTVNKEGARSSGLTENTPIVYRAGDQPNNAMALNVLEPGEIAATGGTSGVLYAVTDSMDTQEGTRINNFAHVNHSREKPRIGKLLCLNSVGILYRWLKDNFKVSEDGYEEMNELTEKVPVGSDGLIILPFGNGAERIFNNQNIGAHILNLNLNIHTRAHFFRAALEGLAFSYAYGMEILKNDGVSAKVIRAGNDNLFRASVLPTTLATLLKQPIEIYETNGATGAARCAGLATGDFKTLQQIIEKDRVATFSPDQEGATYHEAYSKWKNALEAIQKLKTNI